MRLFLISFSRALYSQLHWRMLLLTVFPFLLSVAIWALLLWLGLQPLIDAIHAWFTDSSLFQASGDALAWVGLSSLKPILVPLLAMWMLLPLMILTALLFVGMLAMPAIVAHLSVRNYRTLQRRQGGSLWGSIWVSAGSFIVFAVLWLVTLPLNAIPPFTFLIQPLLWGWLTWRVMAYDALSEHASQEERRQLLRQHRWPLLLIGIVTGTMGAAPSLLWLGGALGLMFFPLLAGFSIWLYVVVFVFSGLWFTHYGLAALAISRGVATEPGAATGPQSGDPVLKDLNPPPPYSTTERIGK
ncbi:EI24 domain-containing protein [Lacisediminimonas profundi]|uniref:EI24 domain-containing protein n=1 Tax=Lacisediminimonas profundi TaxID=2603856 RepID=UPI00124B961F|nr:EI24 domain-containing protein [Lacisediminimonas profundi]